jgi:polyphenol oxidase
MPAFLRPSWRPLPGIGALSTLRHAGDAGLSKPPFDSFNLGNRFASNGDDPAAVALNRARLVAQARLPSLPHWMRKVHGTVVHRFERAPGDPAPAGDDEPEGDAAVTSKAGVVLAILSADCLPVLLRAADGSEVAVAHAGWRGLAAGVLEATLAAMRMPAGQVEAWLGPAAGPDAYEVGGEVRDAFVAIDATAALAFTPTRPGHWHCDMYRLARQRLAAAGVGRVSGGDRCTISEPQHFFSHRRDGRSGRMASLIWIEPRSE